MYHKLNKAMKLSIIQFSHGVVKKCRDEIAAVLRHGFDIGCKKLNGTNTQENQLGIYICLEIVKGQINKLAV